MRSKRSDIWGVRAYWGWGEPSENPEQFDEGSIEAGCPRREADRSNGGQLPGEEMVQTETDWEVTRMDEANSMLVQGKALLSGIYESMRKMGMLGLRQERTQFSTTE